MTEYTIGGTGYVLVEVEETHKPGTGVLGINGKEIIADTSYDPIRFAKNHGKVIQLPSNMGAHPVTQVPVGFPGYGCISGNAEEANPAIYTIGGVYKYRHMWDIEPEVRMGDKIWFKPRVLNNPANMVEETKGKKVFKVMYDQIICAVRTWDISDFDGALLFGTESAMTSEEFAKQWSWKIKDPMPDLKDLQVDIEGPQVINGTAKVTVKHINMIGSWCLLNPIMEDWASILRPTFFPYTNDKGEPIPRPKEQWIQMKVAPGKEKMRGIVKYFGKPLKGDDCDLEPLMKVWIRKVASEWLLAIEGARYIVCRQNQILAEEID